MGGKSVAARAARESARKRMARFSMNDIYRSATAKYPACAGLMPDCPQAIEEPKSPPEKCKPCPNFMESKFYKKPAAEDRVRELHSLFASIRKSHQEIENKEEEIQKEVVEIQEKAAD
jgi:hypothetical protein